MKPEQLKAPFSWKDRQILIQDRIWYVPEYYDQYHTFSFPGWKHPHLFDRPQRVKIEYCSGNGAWILAKALQHPDINWVAIERRFDRVRKIWSKLKNYQLDNLLIVCGEGNAITHHYLPSESVDEVFINFPDPWPKKRHAKNRLIQPNFASEAYRILQPGGLFTLVTDDVDYSQIMIDVVGSHTGFVSSYPAPYFITERADYGTSYFEDLWRSQGKTIHYHQFKKV